MTNKIEYTFDLDSNGFPAFTEKNMALLKFVIKNTSDYSIYSDNDTDEYKNSYAGLLEKFGNDFTKYLTPSKSGKKDELSNSVDTLYEVIASIDKLNSTHLSSEGKNGGNTGRALTARGIRGISNLMTRLSKKDNNIVHEIAMMGGKNNFSFATKFCAFVSLHALKKDNYCIYDDIVQSVLPYYVYMYAEKKEVLKCCKTINAGRKNERIVSNIHSLKTKKNGYKEYRALVNTIIKGIKEKCGIKVSYFELDQMIWLHFKGVKEKTLKALKCIKL